MPILKQIHKRKLLLDTHVWVWVMEGKPVFQEKFLKSLQNQQDNDGLLISPISIWEIGTLVEKKRLTLGMDRLDWVETAIQREGVNLAPLSPKIAIQSTRLPDGVHGDPADRILIATAREHQATLVTCDRKILEFGKGKFLNVFDPRQ